MGKRNKRARILLKRMRSRGRLLPSRLLVALVLKKKFKLFWMKKQQNKQRLKQKPKRKLRLKQRRKLNNKPKPKPLPKRKKKQQPRKPRHLLRHPSQEEEDAQKLKKNNWKLAPLLTIYYDRRVHVWHFQL